MWKEQKRTKFDPCRFTAPQPSVLEKRVVWGQERSRKTSILVCFTYSSFLIPRPLWIYVGVLLICRFGLLFGIIFCNLWIGKPTILFFKNKFAKQREKIDFSCEDLWVWAIQSWQIWSETLHQLSTSTNRTRWRQIIHVGANNNSKNDTNNRLNIHSHWKQFRAQCPTQQSLDNLLHLLSNSHYLFLHIS